MKLGHWPKRSKNASKSSPLYYWRFQRQIQEKHFGGFLAWKFKFNFPIPSWKWNFLVIFWSFPSFSQVCTLRVCEHDIGVKWPSEEYSNIVNASVVISSLSSPPREKKTSISLLLKACKEPLKPNPNGKQIYRFFNWFKKCCCCHFL